MAHVEKKDFVFGTLLVRADILKARAGELESTGASHRDDHDREGETDEVPSWVSPRAPADEEIYTHQEIVGINEVCYNANVTGEPDWQPLEKGLDLGEMFASIAELENKVKGLNMANGRLRRQIETMGLVAKDTEEG